MNSGNMIQVIKDYVSNITNCAAYVGNEIPNVLYRTIMNDFGNVNAQPLAFIDAGMRGGMNEGVLFTDAGIDFRYLGEVGHVAYTDIRSISPIANNRVLICTAYGNYQIDLPFDIGLIVGAIEEILGRTIYTGHKTMPPRPEDRPDIHDRPGMHGEPRPGMQHDMMGNHRPGMQNDMPGNHRPGMQNDMPGNHRPALQNEMPGNHRPAMQNEMPGNHRPAMQNEMSGNHRPAMQNEMPGNHRPGMQNDMMENHRPAQQQSAPAKRPSGGSGHSQAPGRPASSGNSGGAGMGRPGMGGPGGRGGR